MDANRLKQLTINESERLTDQELSEGWHFCPEYDFDVMLLSECGLCVREESKRE